jgi:hypothetical protein
MTMLDYSYQDPDVLPQGKAEVVFEIVKGLLAAYDPTYAAEVRLFEPGFHAKGWTIGLECELDSWPYLLTGRTDIRWPADVYAEPVNHWCLGLYPA